MQNPIFVTRGKQDKSIEGKQQQNHPFWEVTKITQEGGSIDVTEDTNHDDKSSLKNL